MRVDAHVSSGTRQGLAFPIGNVLLGLGVTVLLGHAKVDNVDDVGALGARATDEEVIGLDVTIDEVLLVDGLDARKLGCVSAWQGVSVCCDAYHLFGYHDNSLDGELSVAVVEQVLQARAEEVNDENVVEALLTKVIDIRDPGCMRSVLFLGRRNV
jgi:hypothetical protein